MMKEMNAKWAAFGAFLLVLGATLIKAIPALFSQSGLGSIAGNYVAYVAALCVTITSIGGQSQLTYSLRLYQISRKQEIGELASFTRLASIATLTVLS